MTDSSMSHQFDFSFSYGGNAISADELLNHLRNMMTADHVVEWVTHGLQLPQYAETFRQTAINGLDFPALIENESRALAEELGVKSLLHRTKITQAIVRQIFGIGATSGPPQGLKCENSSAGGIQLHWGAPVFRGYPPVHKYLIQRWSFTTSTWGQIADTSEEYFLDTNVVHLGKPLSYRVQAWGGHGPSDWIVLDGCMAVLLPGSTQSLSHADTSPLEHASPLPHHGEPNHVLLPPLQEKEIIRSSAGNPWAWINSFNGGLLLLAIVSRNSFCFRVTMAAWVIFKVKVLSWLWSKVVEGQESQNLVLRTLARFSVLVLVTWNCIHTKIWILSRYGVIIGRSGPSAASDSARFVTGADSLEAMLIDTAMEREAFLTSNLDTAGLNSPSLFESRLQSGLQVQELGKGHVGSTEGSSSSGVCSAESNLTRGFDLTGPPGIHFSTEDSFSQVDSQSISMSDNPSGTTRNDNDLKNNGDVDCKEHGSKPPQKVEEGLTARIKRRKHRCNHREGCNVRFDRWHSLSDWRMSFSKHFCRECQSVFCVKHTHISPHGPFGQCGLDSSCVCCGCFSTLPIETQHKLETINKLRVGPPVHYESSSSTSWSRKKKMTGTSLLHGVGLPLSLSKSKDLDSTYLDSDSSHIGRELVDAASNSNTDLSQQEKKFDTKDHNGSLTPS